MKKKIMGVILAATLIVSQAVTALQEVKRQKLCFRMICGLLYRNGRNKRGICRGRGSFPTDS